jgi:dihydrofolate reductase
MRKLVYYVATTLDGFIARGDGSLGEFPWDDDYLADLLTRFPETFPAHLRSDDAPNRRFDTVLMGRKTYEVGLREDVTSPYPTLDQYVFSRTLDESPDPAVTLVADGAIEIVRRLKGEPGMDIWLCGGSELATTLHEAGLVDGLIIKLNPVVFGAGIPLLARPVPARPLALKHQHAYASGHVILTYAVDGTPNQETST